MIDEKQRKAAEAQFKKQERATEGANQNEEKAVTRHDLRRH